MPKTACEETALITRAKSGDSSAFEALVRLHYTFVYKVAFKWCRVKEDAEDITQEVFIKLAGKIREFKEVSAFKTWLYRITINTAKDLALKKQRNQVKEAAFLENEREKQQYESLEKGLASQLTALVEALPPKLKDVALLVYSEGLNHKEAAGVLNCAETTVSWRIFQAKKKLKKLLESGGFAW